MLPPKKPDRLSFKWDREVLSLSAEGRFICFCFCVAFVVLGLVYIYFRH
jgi:hypothetical protein